jgi:PadR family transcriptional regulator PadR
MSPVASNPQIPQKGPESPDARLSTAQIHVKGPERVILSNRANIIRNRMSKSKSENDQNAADRDLYSGLIRLHVLHHAVEGPIFGLGMMEELARHGYRISPGSLYPLLQSLERKGYLRSTEQRNGKSLRRVYRATPLGRKALAASKDKVRELFHELIEGD